MSPTFKLFIIKISGSLSLNSRLLKSRKNLHPYMSGFPGGSMVKNLSPNAGDTSSIPGSGRSPGEGNRNPLQCSGLGNPMDRGAWQATGHGVTKSQTWCSNKNKQNSVEIMVEDFLNVFSLFWSNWRLRCSYKTEKSCDSFTQVLPKVKSWKPWYNTTPGCSYW